MKIEKKDNYTLLIPDEKSVAAFYNNLSQNLNDFDYQHLVVNFLHFQNTATKDFLLFLDIAKEKKDNGTSFVLLSTNVSIDEIPEQLNIVPTLTEAEDIIEMETIERELGF